MGRRLPASRYPRLGDVLRLPGRHGGTVIVRASEIALAHEEPHAGVKIVLRSGQSILVGGSLGQFEDLFLATLFTDRSQRGVDPAAGGAST